MSAHQASHRDMAIGLSMALVAWLAVGASAQVSNRRQPAADANRALEFVESAQRNVGADDRPARATVTLGTSREEVESLLGKPATESVIPSLRRVRAVYPDNTSLIYLDGRVLSIRPGSAAQALTNGSYVIQRDRTKIVLEAIALQRCGSLSADELVKCWIEGSVHRLEPGAMPTGYGDFPSGPPHVYWPSPWPIHAERVMPLRLHRNARPRQPIYYRPYQDYYPSPYIVPSAR